jgi:hypothetical protein
VHLDVLDAKAIYKQWKYMDMNNVFFAMPL